MIPDELKQCHILSDEERLNNYRDSEYMGVLDFEPGAEPVLTIKRFYYGSVSLREGKSKKLLLEFEEESVPGIKNVRPMIVNATAREALFLLYKTDKVKDLVGKKIKLHVVKDGARKKDGKRTDCFRIMPEIPRATSPIHCCSECGQVLKPFGKMTAASLAQYTSTKYGRVLCSECAGKEAKVAEQPDASKSAPSEPVEEDKTEGGESAHE